ncbi:MAG: GGDEF domain-containing protein [Haliea sp.]|uniref:GGDEF domain-containing protein n=1 Tax=Haliea sp. TaxID=1932666 RepID=UPI0032EDF5C0
MTERSPFTLVSDRAANLAPDLTAAATSPLGERDAADQLLELFDLLLGESDQDTVLQRFHRWANRCGLADSLGFTAPGDEQEVVLGEMRHHRALYQLNIDGSMLGAVTLSRRQRYSEPELTLLERALGGLARAARLAQQMTLAHSTAMHDGLTGLLNRRAMDERLSQELLLAKRHDSALSLMIIDIDHFKDINDQLGHLAGDEVLRRLAEAFRSCLRESDLLFRLGGDEFAILLPRTGLSGAADVARKIRETVEQVTVELSARADGVLPRVSIGVTDLLPGDDDKMLLQRADTHLYHAKAQGRGRVCISV